MTLEFRSFSGIKGTSLLLQQEIFIAPNKREDDSSQRNKNIQLNFTCSK